MQFKCKSEKYQNQTILAKVISHKHKSGTLSWTTV